MLTILCGLPKSGKTTYAADLIDNGAVSVCPDEIRYSLHGKAFVGTLEPYVWAITETMVRTLSMAHPHVVLNATNTTAARREPWIRLAGELEQDCRIVWLNTPVEECRERNSAADNLSSVPEAVMERMIAQFEPPDDSEGVRVGVVGSG